MTIDLILAEHQQSRLLSRHDVSRLQVLTSDTVSLLSP